MLTAGSVWITRLGRLVLGWMALCVLLVLGLGPIGELLGEFPVSGAVTVLVVLPGMVLAAWSLFATARAPRRFWPAPLAMLAYCTVLWFGGEALLLAGARGYFTLRQPTYEQIITKARSGLLPSEGRTHGVTYWVSTGDYPGAHFQWGTVSWGFFGVLYDEYTCNDRALPPPPPSADAEAIDRPTMKSGRFLNGYYRPLTDKACLTYVVG